jgi:hypothetical protein
MKRSEIRAEVRYYGASPESRAKENILLLPSVVSKFYSPLGIPGEKPGIYSALPAQ